MALVKSGVIGDLRYQIGTYTASSTTATIETGMTAIFHASLESNANATQPIVTFTGGTVTATTASADTGTYFIVGK